MVSMSVMNTILPGSAGGLVAMVTDIVCGRLPGFVNLLSKALTLYANNFLSIVLSRDVYIVRVYTLLYYHKIIA